MARSNGTGSSFFNDLERPAFEKYTLLPVIKAWLRAQPECHAALMSGSGSTMFAVCSDRKTARMLSTRAIEHFGRSMWTAVCEAPS